MDHGHLRMVADTVPWVCSAALRNACGTDVPLWRRQRVITPLRVGLARTAICASQRVEPLADVHGGFHALCGTTVPSKAFDHPVATPHCADCARTMAARLLSAMTRKVLGCEPGQALSALRPILLHDGSACAIHDGVREGCPGRCTAVNPAAVARHTTRDVLCDAPTPVVLPPETASARACLPAPASLRDAVLLAARGSRALHALRRVPAADGGLLLRATAGRHPPVVEALRDDGTRRPSLRNTRLQALHATRPQRQRVARRGQWQVDGHPVCLRLLIRGHPRAKRCCACLTHLPPPPRDPLEGIGRASTWRWHVALRCNAWQSSAHLPAWDPAQVAIVAGLMWTTMAAAARTRCVAHMPHLLAEGPLSPRTVALGAVHGWGDMVRAGQRGEVTGLSPALQAAVTSLACHAQRAYPARDRTTGRAQLGLEPLCADEDVIEWDEAA